MGRKWITALLTLVTVLLMTGCNSDQKDITEATEGFLGAIVKNDMETAAQYATEDFMNSDAMKITDSKILADEFFEAHIKIMRSRILRSREIPLRSLPRSYSDMTPIHRSRSRMRPMK